MTDIQLTPSVKQYIERTKFFDFKNDNPLKLDELNKLSHEVLKIYFLIGEEKTETAQELARHLYPNKDHSCYNNDSFCIAQLFNLEDKIKESALFVIENAMAGYFEPITHKGYNLSYLLYNDNIIDDSTHQDFLKKGSSRYLALKHETIKDIADEFLIYDKELAKASENVIMWCLNQGYNVSEAVSTFSASSSIPIEQAEELAGIYLPRKRINELNPLFEKAKKDSEIRKFPVTYRHRV